MPSITTDQLCTTLLPDNLRSLLKDRAPNHCLTAVAARTSTLLNGQQAELANAWLTPGEQLHLDQYTFDKRRTEWLSGRICAKQAALELLSQKGTPLQPLDFRVDHSPTGRPQLGSDNHGIEATPIDISISHSHGKAIGIAGYGLCGVDIQYLTDTLFKVKTRFCTETESAALDVVMADERTQLGLLWVGKEAVRKCLSGYRLLGFLDMRLEKVSVEEGFHVLEFQLASPFTTLGSVSVTTNVHGGFALAVCTVSRDRLDAGTAGS